MAVWRGKRYKQSAKKVEAKVYGVSAALDILRSFEKAKFIETVDLAFNLNVDTKQSDQMVRGTVMLPHGNGKTIRVAVFSKSVSTADAEEAGADFVGANDLIDKVEGGWLGFDVAIASPEMMKDLSKLGKVLGPRGLMPSPKAGTVTTDVLRTIKEVKKGKVEYKVDKAGNVHIAVGKINFESAQLLDNVMAVIDAVSHARPASVKGNFITSITLSATMSPSVKLDLAQLVKEGT
jgi:large subunit ribosomal protein L1